MEPIPDVNPTPPTPTTFSDTALEADTPYTYRVSAINSVGTGPASNESAATTQPSVSGVTIDEIPDISRPLTSFGLIINGTGFGTGTDAIVTITGGSGPAPKIISVTSEEIKATIVIDLKNGGPSRATEWTLSFTNPITGSTGTGTFWISP